MDYGTPTRSARSFASFPVVNWVVVFVGVWASEAASQPDLRFALFAAVLGDPGELRRPYNHSTWPIAEFQQDVNRPRSDLEVVTGLMALDEALQYLRPGAGENLKAIRMLGLVTRTIQNSGAE